MDPLLTFILGVWIGAVFGVFLHALLVAASWGEGEEEGRRR